MIEIVYYVHGTTIDNEKKIATGWAQVPLSLKGIEQTRKAASQIDGDAFDAIFSSDLIRAKESAAILFATRKNEIRVDQRLRECNYGIYTKKPNMEIVYQEHINSPFPNGESLLDVEMRIRSFLKELQLNNCKKVALVSHRIPQLALDVIISKISWKDAIEKDWRLRGQWKPGWNYNYYTENLL